MNDPIPEKAGPQTQPAAARAPLSGVLVVEHGERLGAAVCGNLLGALGADVVIVERAVGAARSHRAWAAAGKRSVALRDDAHDKALAAQLLECADVVLTSSDVSEVPAYHRPGEQIVCDITAFGSTGPLAGAAYSDALVQAVAGLADTTGDPNGPPTLIGLPFCEVAAGLYAAAGILAAERVRRTRGAGQRVEVALFDCAVAALATFLPFHAIGKQVTRSGNRHSLAAPWNAYQAADGWVLICTATDEQWRRLCTLLGRSELAGAEGYASNAQRIGRRMQIDEMITAWTRELSVQDCIERLSRVDIACGPVLTLEQLRFEPNLAHRGMLRTAVDAVSGATLAVPADPLPFGRSPAPHDRIPAPDADRAHVLRHAALARRSRRAAAPENLGQAPLAGVRVLEIGQYTTAPLVARQLGALGAEVFKIEPPGGEGSRTWPPLQGDQGYFFAFSNSDKRSVELDLRDPRQHEQFARLLRTADVLVENLKPGSLARLGFSPEQLAAINPRLVYCAISGFGARSIYPGRPAFDTVVQAMSGFMDLTRAGSVPTKAGISAADIMGGELALVAVLAALEMRDAAGVGGQVLDISMQDAAVWATASRWTAAQPTDAPVVVRCEDGYVCVERADQSGLRAIGARHEGTEVCAGATRAAVVAAAQRAGLAAAPVATISEVAESEQTRARRLIIQSVDADGRTWPLLASPVRLELTPAEVRRPISRLGEANAELS